MLQDVHVFRFNESLFFPNSHRLSARILDSVQTHHGPIYNGSRGTERERNWSVVAEKRINRLRKAAGVTDPSALPPINMIVLDFGRVNHIDITGVTHLKTMTAEVYKYGGKGVEFRFVDMSPYVRERFERSGWRIVDGSVPLALSEADEAKQTRLFNSVAEAVMAPRMRDQYFEEQYLEKSETVNTLKPTASYLEDA